MGRMMTKDQVEERVRKDVGAHYAGARDVELTYCARQGELWSVAMTARFLERGPKSLFYLLDPNGQIVSYSAW